MQDFEKHLNTLLASEIKEPPSDWDRFKIRKFQNCSDNTSTGSG